MTAPWFYVHIIESPSPEDLLDGLSEGATLCNFLQIAGVPYLYNLVVDRQRLDEALTVRVMQGLQRNLVPVIHIAAHGGEEGIQLTDQRKNGELVTWKELAALLAPINTASGGKLGIGLSCCRGKHGKSMAHVVKQEHLPVSWIVGTEQDANYCDLALAFVSFYRALQRGTADAKVVFDAIRVLTGVTDFDIEFGDIVQQQYSADLARRMVELLQKLKPTPNHPGYQLPPGLGLPPFAPPFQPAYGYGLGSSISPPKPPSGQ